MIETRNIETAPGLVFDASVAGPQTAPLVLMLHGFCVSRHFWDNQIPALAAAGCFVVAPNQRGYAAGARPDPAEFDNYRIDKLIGRAQDQTFNIRMDRDFDRDLSRIELVAAGDEPGVHQPVRQRVLCCHKATARQRRDGVPADPHGRDTRSR